ncbi:hypothetical protein AMS68_001828 [Peltaster fructicola]|uniref:Dynactin subunit 4 n=1 Tax=Peltaster fructicola TaxID=286661 RepID=A0A6H0XNS9_9PEZI|nr:hypothetical protein AMS68_001828 [Peltaster fructicola]
MAIDMRDENTDEDAYILACQYCSWSSLDINVRFDKPTKITDQLKRARKAQHNDHGEAADRHMSSDERFTSLEAFYKEQLIASGEATGGVGYGGYGSPANLSRIINLYGGISHNALKKSQEKPAPMREALAEEGLKTYDESTSELDIVQKMSESGWHGTTSSAQRYAAPIDFNTRMLQDLWPAPVHLKTKRGKRCRQCKQFVFRPDQRLNGPRPRLRIIAMNFIPRLSLRPLDPTRQVVNHSFLLKHEQPPTQPLLQPHVAQQYVLTLRNPIFETVKVTLAASATTPGRVASKVTILCPSFTIGPAGDVWDEALSTPTTGASDGSRKAAMASLTGNNESDRQPEAGKVWEQTRNSTSVVLEIVPGALAPPPSIFLKDDVKAAPVEEGDDILEVPVYVRVEWTAELATEGEQKGTTERVARELAYWCVLGVGRIAK